MIKIKPCPFCGEECLHWKYEDQKDIYNIECDSCGSEGPTNHEKVTLDEAISKWNRRVWVQE